jgi:hypothetical protein
LVAKKYRIREPAYPRVIESTGEIVQVGIPAQLHSVVFNQCLTALENRFDPAELFKAERAIYIGEAIAETRFTVLEPAV